MSNPTKRYALTSDLLEALDDLGHNRSLLLRQVLATSSPSDLLLGLRTRLSEAPKKVYSASVTVKLDEKGIAKLEELADLAQLPVEHALRLLIQAYICRATSHKESHGPATSLEPAASQ